MPKKRQRAHSRWNSWWVLLGALVLLVVTGLAAQSYRATPRGSEQPENRVIIDFNVSFTTPTPIVITLQESPMVIRARVLATCAYYEEGATSANPCQKLEPYTRNWVLPQDNTAPIEAGFTYVGPCVEKVTITRPYHVRAVTETGTQEYDGGTIPRMCSQSNVLFLK